MSGRNAAFGADEESSSVLKSLGYTDEQIGSTPGEATPDDLRTSLRQLSAAHSSDVQERVEATAPLPNPKFQKTIDTPDSPDYWQGRKDEAVARKDNMNPGGGAPKPKSPNPGRRSPQSDPQRQMKQTMKQLGRIAKTFGGGTSASKTLGGVTRAQRGRRGR